MLTEMIRYLLTAAVALSGALPLGGCICPCGNKGGARITEAHARAKVIERLRTDRYIATDMCGSPATGLTDVVVDKVDFLVLSENGNMKLSGLPAGKDRSVQRCSGLVFFWFFSVMSSTGVDGELKKLELKEVHTPGVKWSRPKGRSHDFD